MARTTLKEQVIDNEVIYAYAKTNKLPEIEEFLTAASIADVLKCGERCYDGKLYAAAKILFTNTGNNQKLASTLVHLKEFQAALEAARKANIPKCWKEVCFACIRYKEFRLASIAGLNIIILPDHLEDLIT